jgi:hypothetical protein
VALIATIGLATSARAQVIPPPPVPQLPDEPLPVWKPPTVRSHPFHLRASAEAERAHSFRQAGLWLASFGGASVFAGGLLFANASDINDSLSHSHNVVVSDGAGGYREFSSVTFDPALEDQRDQRLAASQALLIGGGVCLATGVVLFAIGQLRLRTIHREHPHDPLPPLSGYDTR